jgi:uncharacterized membrane protein YfcA
MPELELSRIVIAGAVVFFAAAAQSAVGFGYALFATPLLLWVGLPLPSVIALVASCSALQAMIGAHRFRGVLPWRLSVTATAVRLVSLVVGLFMLKHLVALEPSRIRAAIGCVLCILVVIQICWKPRQTANMHWGWGGVAFLGSGFLAGICGMGGPPLVLWAMAHDWSTQKTRGFLFAVFATTLPVQIVLLTLTFGRAILWSVVVGMALLPLVYLGSHFGLTAGNRMSKERLKSAAYTLLIVIGASAVFPMITASLSR